MPKQVVAERELRARGCKFGWRDSCDLCLKHPAHAPYFVERLWSYFVAAPMPSGTRAALIRKYRRGYKLKPLLKDESSTKVAPSPGSSRRRGRRLR